jgi:hypothetical protein
MPSPTSAHSSFYAYQSAKAAMNMANHRIAGTITVHLNKEGMNSPTAKVQYDAAQKYRVKEARYSRFAIIAGVVSLAAFVAGTLISGLSLMSAARLP